MTFNNNQVGQINPNGDIWVNTANWSGMTFGSTNSYQEMTGLGTNFSLQSDSSYFDMPVDGRLRYIGEKDDKFIVNGYFANNNSGAYAIAIYKNGSLVTGAESYCNGSAILEVSSLVSLSKNDYVSLFMKRSANLSITIYQVTLSI